MRHGVGEKAECLPIAWMFSLTRGRGERGTVNLSDGTRIVEDSGVARKNILGGALQKADSLKGIVSSVPFLKCTAKGLRRARSTRVPLPWLR